MSTGSDEFEAIARETLDRIIEIIENDSSIEVEVNENNININNIELNNLVEELDILDENNLSETNKELKTDPISSDLLNKSLRLINLEAFEDSPTTSETRIGLRSNKNIIHTEYIKPKRIVKKKMPGNSEAMKPLSAVDAIKLIPNYSGQTEIYPFLSACEVIIEQIDEEQLPFMLKMIAATKLTDRAFNVTRYREIKEWGDMKKLLLDAFETPYGAANLQIELNNFKNEK